MDSDPKSFLALRADRPVLDVRAPSEYASGHIPGAHSFSLFSDDERARIGTIYKKEGRDQAVALGLEIVGPKLTSFVAEARKIAPSGKAAVYCWRGGMRSDSMAWLLRTAGFDVVRAEGGYKAYRQRVHESFEWPLRLINLAGMTGSGKTDILHALRDCGEQVIDLEGLARHRGSAFGSHAGVEQPTTEHFENLLHDELQNLDPERPVWIEDESRQIGRVVVPPPLFHRFRSGPTFLIERNPGERVSGLTADYQSTPREELIESFHKIGKRLGGQHVKAAVEALETGNLAVAAEIALHYYDKTYVYGLKNRDNPGSRVTIDLSGKNPAQAAKILIDALKQMKL